MTITTATSEGLHVAIIMDGNGRWAQARGLPRIAGHRAGVQSARRAVEAAPDLDIRTLTLYAFSSDNWQRPHDEVAALMGLLRTYLWREKARCLENGVRIRMIGRRDRLDPTLLKDIESAESATAAGSNLDLRLAIDYSARDTIVRAAEHLSTAGSAVTRETLARAIAAVEGATGAGREVDLLIRTGGEQRLSDFLLWECAYAELYFTPVMWPSFGPGDLKDAVAEFHTRQRRFGRIPESKTG
jgi:undecaprenyl diphosphate synthase